MTAELFDDDQVLQATGARRARAGGASAFSRISTDSRQLSRGALFVALVGEKFDGHAFLGAAAQAGAGGAVVQPGRTWPENLPPGFALYEVPDTLVALGQLARFHRNRFQIPVGAITGSNGKTTTKEMVGAILATRGPALRTEGNFNNEVGVPLTLFRLSPAHVAAVIEMGMNHPGEIDRLTRISRPRAGLITVIQPAHLHGLGSVEGVAEAKGELFRALEPGALAVVNADDARIVAQAAKSGAQVLTFGRAESAEVRLTSAEPRGRAGLALRIAYAGREHRVSLSFLGAHNALNATGAFALAVALGYPAEACVQGLEAARPYAQRLNVVDAPGGITVLDDCYNANPSSMSAALATLVGLAGREHAVAVLGDMLELGEGEMEAHRRLGEEAAAHARAVAFFGPRSSRGQKAASALGPKAAHFTDIEPLLEWLRPCLQPGDVVLVKGSRGMRLERVVEALTGRSAEAH